MIYESVGLKSEAQDRNRFGITYGPAYPAARFTADHNAAGRGPTFSFDALPASSKVVDAVAKDFATVEAVSVHIREFRLMEA